MATSGNGNGNGMAYMPNCGALRAYAGLSQSELSRLADVSRDLIANVERGEKAKVEKLNRIAAVFEEKIANFGREKEIVSTRAAAASRKRTPGGKPTRAPAGVKRGASINRKGTQNEDR